MGTKAKLSTKVISVVLSALMALSCVYVALPSLAPKAFAATAEQIAWQNLHDAFESAFNGGYLSTKDWSSINASGGVVTLDDGTPNGYAYNIVVAIGELVKLDGIGVGRHNSELIALISDTLNNDYDYELNTYQTNFLGVVLDTSGKYGQYSPSSIWNGSNADFTANLTAQTITVNATRLESAAILSDFEDIDALAAADFKIVKSYSITINAEAQKCPTTNGSETGAYYANTAVTAAPGAAEEASSKTLLQNIKLYQDFVSADAFKVPFETWYNNGGTVNTASLYTFTSEQVNTLRHDFLEKYNPVYTGDLSIIEEYIGKSNMDKHKEFVDAAYEALSVVSYKDYVAWLVNGTPYGHGTRNRGDYDPTNPESIEAVIGQATAFEDAMDSCSADSITILKGLYPGFDPSKAFDMDDERTYYASFANLKTYLSSVMYNFYLQEIKAAANVLLNNNSSVTYTFSNEASKFFNLLKTSVENNSGVYQTGFGYVLTTDKQVNQDKTYYTVDADYSFAATEDTDVNTSKHYFTKWAAVESPVASSLGSYYEDVEVFTYALTEDTEIVEGHTYYTLADGVYTEVETPAAESLGAYYVRTGSYHEYQLTGDTSLNAAKTYYAQGDYEIVTSPSKAYIGTYAERTLTAYHYQLTGDTVLMDGKKYYTLASDVYTEVAEPDAEALGTYYEVKFNAVAHPLRSYLFEYYEAVGSYYGLKGVGTGEYVEANYESSYSKTGDTAVDPDKTYYTYDEETGVYEKVTSPVAAELKDYYERAVCPIDDTDLAALYTFFNNAVITIGEARSAGVEITNYMTAVMEQQINEMKTALYNEQIARGRVSEEFLKAYQPACDKMAAYIKGGHSIQDLYKTLREMETKRSSLRSSFSWFSSDARDAAMGEFIQELYCEIYDRVQAQFIEIQNEYREQGGVNVKNYYQLRQNLNRINDLKVSPDSTTTVLSFIGSSYGSGKITGTNATGKTRNSSNLSILYSYFNEAENKIDYDNGTAVYPNNNSSTISYKVDHFTVNNVYSTIYNNNHPYEKNNIIRKGKEADMVRTTSDQFTAWFQTNAEPTSGKYAGVANTVTKLDKFLANSQFTMLLGADETGRGITTLDQYIEMILVDNVFTDNLVNKLVALLFPMLTDLFEKTIPKVLEENVNHNGSGLNLGSLDQDWVEGTLWVYYNGGTSRYHNHGTVSFANMLHQLGVDIYPEYFGPYLVGKGYTTQGNSIAGANHAWSKFRANGAETDADGNYTSDVVFDFDWGIDSTSGNSIDQITTNRYNRFCTVLGDIFGSAFDLMNALFGSTDFSRTSVKNFAVASAHLTGSGKWYLSEFFWFGATHNFDAYDVDISITVNAVRLYDTLWVPLMEALGMNGDLMSYNFGYSASNGSQMVHALFDPLKSLIHQVATKPVESVMKLLPNLCYHLMAGSADALLNRHIVLRVKGNDASLDGDGIIGTIVENIGNAFSERIAGAIDIKEAIDLSTMLNLEKLLGFSLKDINTVLAGVLALVKKDSDVYYEVQVGTDTDGNPIMEKRVNLPGIGTGKVATMWKSISNTYGSKAYTVTYGDKEEIFTSKNGHRTYVTANTEVVFYALFDWLFRAAQTKGGLADILSLVSAISGSDLGDKLPGIVYALVEGIESSDLAFAALIELLNEPEYNVAGYNWYQPNAANTPTPWTYLDYGNKWTVSKAKYIYNNVDNIVNAVVNMITPETLEQFDGDVNVWLDRTINSMFNNEGIMNVIEVVIKLGGALAGSPAIAKLLRQQIKSTNGSDPAMNLYSWYNVWGYLYDDVRDVTVDAAKNEFLAYNLQNNQVFVYQAESKDSNADPDAQITLQSGNSIAAASAANYLPYTWKIVQAYPVAPGEVIPWTINGTNMTYTNVVPYNKNTTSDYYQTYENMFSNLRWTDAGHSEDGDLLYTWEVKLTSDIISHLQHKPAKGLERVGSAGSYTGYKDGNATYNVGSWYPLVDGGEFDNASSLNARAVFTAVFCELAGPLSALFSFILCGKDLYLFGTTESTALTIKGYPSYNNAILPLLEAMGVYGLKTQTEYNTYATNSGSKAAFDYLVNKLFDAMDNLLEDDRVYDDDGNVTSGKGAFQKLIDVLPHLFYFLQSEGVTTLLKNLPMFAWQLLDTLRPIANIDVDDVIHALLPNLLGLKYKAEGAYKHNALTTALVELINKGGAKPSNAEITRDAHKISKIFEFSLKNMTLESVYALVEGLTGLNLTPLNYALKGMIAYATPTPLSFSASQTEPYRYTSYQVPQNYNTYRTYTINFDGWDTITVTLEALLDILRYEWTVSGVSYSNAEALDELMGTVAQYLPGSQNLLTGEGLGGLIQAIVKILDDEPYNVTVDRPNWDYIFEERLVKGSDGNTTRWRNIVNTDETLADASAENYSYNRWAELSAVIGHDFDFHEFHLNYMTNLRYLTSWTEEVADQTTDVLLSVLDYVCSLIDLSDNFDEGTDVSTFSNLVNALLAQKVFTPDLMIKLVDLLANVYTYLPDDILSVIDALLTDNEGSGAVVDMFAWRDSGLIIKDYPWYVNTAGDTVQHAAGDTDDDGEPIEPVWQANRSYDWFTPGNSKYIDSEEDFLNAFSELLEPAGTLFAVIMLSEDYNLFRSMKNNSTGHSDAIVINGVSAYATALVPILEALGLDLTDYAPTKYDNHDGTYNGSLFIDDLIEMIHTLFSDIIYGPVDETTHEREGGPVKWLLANFPNIIYFINADGIKASIDNVFSALNAVLDAIATVVDLPFDLHNVMESGLDLTNLTFEGIFGMIYTLTKSYDETGKVIPGLYMNPSLLQYLNDLYIGEIVGFRSINGYQSYKMVYSDAEDESDMVTILLALLIEWATDSGTFVDNVDSHGAAIEYNNADALDRLLFAGKDMEGVIGQVIHALRNPADLAIAEMDWDYFVPEGETFNISALDDHPVTVPYYAFQYLNWTTEWTYTKAETAEDEFETLIFQVLKMLVPDDDDIEEGSLWEKVKDAENLREILSIDFIFSADILNSVLDFLTNFLYGEDSVLNADLIALIGYVLGGDLTQWDGTAYGFVTVDEYPTDCQTETVADIAGVTLKYLTNVTVDVPAVLGEDGETVITPATTKTLAKQYQIKKGTRADFIAGLTKVLVPAKGILAWLLFGEDYTFFNPHDTLNEYLITIPGSDGYKEGLILLLEALGWDSSMKYAEAYVGHTMEFISDLANSVADGAEAICIDPVGQILNLIPELIYFINANGLAKVVTGLLSGPLGLVNQISVLEPVIQKMLKLPETVTGATDSTSQYALVEKTVDSVIKSLLTKKGYTVTAHDDGTTDIDFKLNGINLAYVFNILEVITGMEITDVIGNRLDMFAIGQIHAYASKCDAEIGAPKTAYKMTFNTVNGTETSHDAFADFITILLSAVVDLLEYQQPAGTYANVEALAATFKLKDYIKGILLAVVKLLKTELNAEILPIDWFYFDNLLSRYTYDSENDTLTLKDPVPVITQGSLTTIPAASVNYLTYASDWTKDTSEYIVDHFSEIIDGVLGMFVKDEATGEPSTLADIINDNFSLANNVFTYKNYKAVIKAVTDIAGKIPDVVNTLLNIALELDLSSLGSLTALTEAQYDALDDNGKKNAFVSAIISIVTPLRPIVEWFFFNQNLEYFDKKEYGYTKTTDTAIKPGTTYYTYNAETEAYTAVAEPAQENLGTYYVLDHIEVLISIGGASGYNDALVPLLEAIGVDCPSYTVESGLTAAEKNVKFGNFLSILIEKVLIRVEEILQDPADAVINLLPNLIYFLNTNALATVFNNLVAPVISVINEALPALFALTADVDLDDPETDPDDIKTKLAQVLADNDLTAESVLTMSDVIKIVMALLAEEPEEGEAPADTGVLDYILTNINFNKLDLVAILRLVEGLLASGTIKVTEKDNNTGVETTKTIQANIKLVDVVGEDKIDNFYLNDIEYFLSANGKPAFRMPGSADMITVIVNYLLEVLLYQTESPAFSNAEELDKILDNGKETPEELVTRIVDLILGIRDIQEVAPATINWHYYGESTSIGDGILVPNHKFVYLNYSNQWSFEKAVYLDEGLEDLVKEILTIAGVEDGDISKLIGEYVNLADYLNAETLNTILGFINGLFNNTNSVSLPKALTDLIGLVLNVDITAWDGSYDFVAEGTAAATENGLGYYESDGVRHYIINANKVKVVDEEEVPDYSDFSSGLQLLLSPAQGLLGWLLLGNTFGFFVPSDTGNVVYTITSDTEIDSTKTYYTKNGDVYTAVAAPVAADIGTYYEAVRQKNELIRVPGSKGYDTGLVLLLEALGCEGLKAYTEYELSDGTYDAAALLKDVIDVLLARVNEILQNPIEELLALIPEIIYFININGLGAMVQNIASVLLAIVNEVLASGLLDSMVDGDLKNYLTENGDGTNAEGEPYNGTYKVDLDAIMNDLLETMMEDKWNEDLTFSFASVDLQYVINVVEAFTGLEIDDVVGYTMDQFIIGVVKEYASASETYTKDGAKTYKLEFAEADLENPNVGQTRADMITILLSLALDLLDNSQNVNALVALVNGIIEKNNEKAGKPLDEGKITAATVNSIVALLKGGNLDAMQKIDWFYFDPDYSIYDANSVLKEDPPTVDYSTTIATPARTINYIQYYTDWTKADAEYLVNNINPILEEVFNLIPGMAGKTVADLIAGYFTVDQLYNEDIFVKVIDFIQGLINDYGETLVNTLGLILGADFSTLAEIDTETLDVSTKEKFASTLVTVLEPAYVLLNWLLFGEDMKYFYDNEFYRNGGGATTPELYDDARNLINLTGAEGYKYGLVPLLDALGVELPMIPTENYKLVAGGDVEESFLYKVVIAVLNRMEAILANPVDEVVALLPELLYFINAGGLTASVFNLVNAVYGLLPQISALLATFGVEIKINNKVYTEIDLNAIVNDMLAGKVPDDYTLDVTHIDLMAIVNLIEAFTGLEISDVVTQHNIRYFYFGKLEFFESTSGKPSFKMVYSDTEGRAEMITLLLNFIVEVLLYKDEVNGIDNVAALEELLGLDDDTKEIVDTILKLLTGDEDIYTYRYSEMKWNYYDETVVIKTVDPDTGDITINEALTVPTSQYIYLEYANDWTLARADGIDKSLAELVDGVMGILKPNGATSVSALLHGYYDGFAKDTIFTAENLNAIIELLQKYLYGDDAVIGKHLAELAGLVLGGDITGWNYTYSFAEYDEDETYISEITTGLRYNADSGAKVYAIETEEDFINGLCLILQPASNLLGWLLLGNDYNFFASAQNHDTNDGLATYDILIKVPGTDAYGNALALLLEALGVEGLKKSSEYNGDASALIRDILTGLVNRIDDILAKPVDEVLDLIPELIYFINAGGLSVVVNNLVGPLLNIVNAVIDKFDLSSLNVDILEDMIIDGKLEPIKYVEAYVTDLLNRYTYEPVTFTLDGVNTGWAVELIEALTDVQIMNVLGTDYPISKFVLGTPTRYVTNSNFDVAYKIAFPETDKYNYRCDLITIVLSFAIEFLENTHNQVIIEDEFDLTAGLIADVLALVKERSIQITPDYDWFYFDTDHTFNSNDLTFTAPERTINYLTYASNWDEDFADYLDDHLNGIIAAVLELMGREETTVGQILEGYFTMSDVYKVENLETIRDAIKGLVEQLETMLTEAVNDAAASELLAGALDLFFDIDLHAWDEMTFDAAAASTKQGFAAGLAQILDPLHDVIKWLFFGGRIALFNHRYAPDDIQDIIVINGYDGYNEGLVPLLEALGVDLTEAAALNVDVSFTSKIEAIITAVLTRAETILSNPVDEVLALLPEILYFINANGLAASVNHMLGSVLSLVDGVNALLADLGVELNIEGYSNIDVNGLVNSLLNNALADKLDGQTLEIDTQKLDLIEIVKIVEQFTGLQIVDVVTETKIDNFYLGQIVSYPSANGKTLFKMVYSEYAQKDRADMLTVLANFLVEVALANKAKLEEMFDLEEGTIDLFLNMLDNLAGENYPYDWNYFYGAGHTPEDGYEAAFDRYATPDVQFGNYLTYKSDWTKTLANDLYNNLDTIINSVLAMTHNEYATLGEIINHSFTLYKGEYLNKILELVQKLYDVIDNTVLLGVADELLDIDLTYWQTMPAFEDRDYESTEFAAAIIEMVQPIYSVLDWLFLGKDITLFVDNAAGGDPEHGGYNLIVVPSVDAYATGLVPILEALGVELPAYDGTQTCATPVVYNGVQMSFFGAIVNAALDRVNAILADPIPEAFELLPELLYFVNANGLSTAVYNMLGGVIEAVNTLIEKGIINLDGADSIETYVFNAFGIDITKLDLVGIFEYVEGIDALHGLKLNDVFTVANDFNDGVTENILEYFYVGDYANAYVSSAKGFKGYKLSLDEENKGDLLTMLLSVVLEVLLYDENEGPITEIIQGFRPEFDQDTFHALKLLLTTGLQTDPTMENINWVYFWNYSEEELQAKITDALSNRTTQWPAEPALRTQNALAYSNNWNRDVRDYLNQNLESIIDLAIQMATKNSDTPAVSLSDLLANVLDLWSSKDVNPDSLDLANLLLGYIKRALGNIDAVLVDTVGSLLGAGQLSNLMNAEARGLESKEDFVDFMVETLSPLSNVLDFVLFGGEYKFFTKLDNGEPWTIILKGGEGYKYGLAPILAALGVDTDITVARSDVALREVFTNLTNRIDDILYGGDTVNEALKLILNVIYFIDADGLSISVKNLLAPIDALLKEVNDALLIKTNDDGTPAEFTVNSLITQVDLENLGFDFIFDLVEDKTGIDVGTPIGDYLKTFYFGATEFFTSYGDLGNFRMVYSEAENRIDFITVVVTLLLDVVIFEGNHDALVALVQKLMNNSETEAEQYVDTIVALLTNREKSVPMQNYKWAFLVAENGTPIADTGIVISAANGRTGDSIFNDALYGDIYTRDMGVYMSTYLPLAIDTYIVLLGVKKPDGSTYTGLNDIIKNLIGTSIYTNKNLRAIADAITGAVANLKSSIGDQLFNHIVNVFNASLGVDLNDLLYGNVATITDGNEEQFIKAICDLLAPVAPVLRWLLSSDASIALFTHDVKVNSTDTTYSLPSDENDEIPDDYIILNGADGYQNAIIPILEALCVGENSNIKTQAEFDAIEDNSEMFATILKPIFKRLDTILDDPIVEIFKELPAVVYFLNSNGLDTAVKNLLNAVYSLLYTIEPLIANVSSLHNSNGEIDLLALANIDLSEINVNTLLQMLIDNISDDIAQYDLTDVIADAVTELTLGTVDKFTSVRELPEYLYGTYANGQVNHTESGNAIDYTMHYSASNGGGDTADYVSIILRLLLKFISIPQNVQALEALLSTKLTGDGYKFVCSLLENFSQMAATDKGMQKIMYTVYYIFYAALNAGVATNNGLARFNGDYSFLNNLFATSNVSFLRQLEISLGDLLNKYTPEIVDDDEVIPQGQISFWQKIINFFKKIGDFFKRLFGG